VTAPSRIVAVLGPTNTGKTTYAIERMLAHRTGVIGLPLRLLAREVYDRCVELRGPSVVALVTGEERIVPPRAQYWVCTVEAMPEGMGADFVAVDEIQLCADPERGHVFTDRLLRARGLHETTKQLGEGTEHHQRIEANLHLALDLAESCGTAYATAPDHIKKLFNQAFFVRILVNPDASVRPELAPPFNHLLGPLFIKRVEL
jgi:hypothetical protein